MIPSITYFLHSRLKIYCAHRYLSKIRVKQQVRWRSSVLESGFHIFFHLQSSLRRCRADVIVRNGSLLTSSNAHHLLYSLHIHFVPLLSPLSLSREPLSHHPLSPYFLDFTSSTGSKDCSIQCIGDSGWRRSFFEAGLQQPRWKSSSCSSAIVGSSACRLFPVGACSRSARDGTFFIRRVGELLTEN
jgi:hypothetical protein